MATGKYINKDGSVLLPRDRAFANLRDPAHAIIRRYDNDKVRAEVRWFGGPFPQHVPNEHCRPFRFTVENWSALDDMDGWRVSPMDTEQFRTEKEAIDCYENFLVMLGTGCEWVNDPDTRAAHFIERGNKLRPPSPDDPTMPESDEAAAEMGSW